MLCRKSTLLALATAFGFRLLADPASTDEPADPARPATTVLNATLKEGEVIGREKIQRVFMNVGGRRLMLVVPLGYRAETTNPGKVVLVNADYSCVLSFRIAAPANVAATSLDATLCRGWLSARLGALKIQEELALTAANQSGPAFVVSHKANGLSRSGQIAFIPSAVGVLEFSLASSPEESQAARQEFHGLLLGFRISDANGELEIPPPPRPNPKRRRAAPILAPVAWNRLNLQVTHAVFSGRVPNGRHSGRECCRPESCSH